ncbi:amyloid-beta precursor-like protein [Apostichopus japonicus]|uniref:amyloid-beta precursor-like protein n=1 Tax=Stichopus japonicus TaxID=307972 RepID=UPI003AB80E2B
MALMITVSISVLFTLLSWTSASYVEAVAGAYDNSQTRQNLQVAMACGHFNKFLDPATRHWTDDLTSTCLVEKSDVLTYCQKKYPGFDVTNIVEADHPVNITSWCSEENQDQCTTFATVVPYRCLVGAFESDALVVPSLCRFRHLHEEGTCQTPQQWKKSARNSCRKSKTKLASTGMLLPCSDQVDMYQGVEFVCCPRSGHEEEPPRPVETAPVNRVPSNQEPTPAAETEDPYLSGGDNRDESQAFKSAKDRLSNKQRERVATVMQQYQEAQKKLDPSAKNYAAKKKELAKRYDDTIGDLEVETEQKQVELQKVHEHRIESNLDDKINIEEQNYWDTLAQEPLKSKKILRSFEKYLKSVQKKRKHLISYYKHLRRADPDKAAKQTDGILRQLKESALRVDGNIDRLQKLPDTYAEIEASIANLQDAYSDNDDDTRFIHGVEEEGEGEDEDEDDNVEEEDNSQEEQEEEEEGGEPEEDEEPTGDVPQQVTSIQSKTTEGTRKEKTIMRPTMQEEGHTPEEEEEDENEDVEYPTEFRTTLNVPEDETEVIPEIPMFAVKPIESYTEEEKDVIPSKSFQPHIVAKKLPANGDHSKTEHHVRSKPQAFSADKTISKKALNSTPALAFALACAVIGVVMGLIATVLVIKKKTRRPQVSQSFTEVDPNLTVEQRHIVSMQQNGYENPTYKYFEMQ